MYYFYHLSYRGTSGIDIDLRKVDINQCPAAAVDDQEIDDQIETGSKKHDIFGGTDKCKSETTKVSLYQFSNMPNDKINRNTVFLQLFNQLVQGWELIHISTIIDVYGINYYWFMRIKVSFHQL